MEDQDEAVSFGYDRVVVAMNPWQLWLIACIRSAGNQHSNFGSLEWGSKLHPWMRNYSQLMVSVKGRDSYFLMLWVLESWLSSNGWPLIPSIWAAQIELGEFLKIKDVKLGGVGNRRRRCKKLGVGMGVIMLNIYIYIDCMNVEILKELINCYI